MPEDKLQQQTKVRHRTRMLKADERGMVDVPFLVLVLMLTAIGLIMLFSASYARSYYETGSAVHVFLRQAMFAAVGAGAMFFLSRLPTSLWFRTAPMIMGVCMLLMILTPFFGNEYNGARRWFMIGGIQFQPSEATKFAMILMYANMIARYGDKMKKFKYGVLPFGVILVTIVGTLALEPHLSAAVIFGLLTIIMMSVGGTNKWWFIAGFAVAAVFVLVFLSTQEYAMSRVDTWLHPEDANPDDVLQTLQAKYAIGSGGLFGLGFGKGRQKYMYLPEEHNDYVFAIICEELGLIGAVCIIILFALLIIRGCWIAIHANNRFDAMLVVGIISLTAIQTILNMSVVTGLIPATGVSLPFFSYGGTALMMQLGEMGIILSVSRANSGSFLGERKKA